MPLPPLILTILLGAGAPTSPPTLARITGLESTRTAAVGVPPPTTVVVDSLGMAWTSPLPLTVLAAPHALRAVPLGAPVPVGVITSLYTIARLHPILHRLLPHFGLDIAAPFGTPIDATADGIVVGVARTPTYGNVIDIAHGNGFVTRYAHAERILVHVGDRVRAGTVIALVGATGRVTGPHVHYEIFVWGRSIDPLPFVRSTPAGARFDE